MITSQNRLEERAAGKSAMNSYLQMSLAVLSSSGRSMSAREILEAAYRLQVVPDHLFGKTQHKTLQARLSEEIMRNRNDSVFTRTAPGRFAVRTQTTKSERPMGGYVAPKRSYQLKKFDVLCADARELELVIGGSVGLVLFSLVSRIFKKQMPLRRVERDRKLVRLRLMVIIRHHDKILTLASIDGSDMGTGRSLGLLGYVKGDDADLFSTEPYGIDAAAQRTVIEQSSVPREAVEALSKRRTSDELRCVRIIGADDQAGSLVLLAEFECLNPDEFIGHVPAHRAPRWSRVPSDINDISGLEPVSRHLMTVAGCVAIL